MAHEDYEDAWDDFLDAYQAVKKRSDQILLLIADLIDNIEGDEDKDRYLIAYKEIVHGESISNS